MQSCGSKGLKRSTSPARKVMYTLYLLHDDVISTSVDLRNSQSATVSDQDILMMGAVPREYEPMDDLVGCGVSPIKHAEVS